MASEWEPLDRLIIECQILPAVSRLVKNRESDSFL